MVRQAHHERLAVDFATVLSCQEAAVSAVESRRYNFVIVRTLLTGSLWLPNMIFI